jgi:hypothetical protein
MTLFATRPGTSVVEGSFKNMTEVMVNGPDDMYVERKGRIERVRAS